mmetsp:Transcript_41669/g.53757  ORF Transcript_41669/g.53757 Transcript_41669/m.53757 type:complete len:500 (-) Transcript_41669:38-1537(-)
MHTFFTPRNLNSQEEIAHEFDALNSLLFGVILGLCVLSSYLIKKYKYYFIPESAATLMVGLLVGAIARVMDPSKAELDFLSFDPEFFFFLLLPPIIFEAGYTLRSKQFFRNIGTIVAYAVIGTMISTFIVGYLVLAIGKLGWIDIDTEDPMEALLFGALISAVDPVATLSIMGNPELHCDPLLYSLVFGESVLNDAVAIVLFRVFMRYYGAEKSTNMNVPAALGEFVVVSLGSVVVGVLIGLLCSLLFKKTLIRSYPSYEIGLLFLFAYASYALAEALELSGIMSLFFCGIILAHYNSYNLSEVSNGAAEVIFHSLAFTSETFVFLYMGMGLFTGRFSGWSPIFIICAILFCLLARVFNTFPVSAAANLARKVKISYQMQFVIWFAGLRGAIAFALSQNMPGPHKDVYETTTLGVVIFTTIVCGGLTEQVLTALGMKRTDLMDETELPSSTSTSTSIKDSKENPGGFHMWWKRTDATIMKPLFGGSNRENAETKEFDEN